RDVVFDQLEPTPPEFQLAGDAERVAITCAALGVDARDLDLPVPLDRKAYRDAVELLTARGLIEHGRLTRYGREVEAIPVERPWGELSYHADAELSPMVAVAANIESLHRMTREERELRGLVVSGSDHLTAYNVYAEAVNKHGYPGEVYGLPRHLFRDAVDDWAEGRGVLVKAIEAEEHTSELQSRENLVCRLLLEKKKNNTMVTLHEVITFLVSRQISINS